MRRFVIVGLGNFGAGAAEALHEMGHEVAALDLDEKRVDRIAPHVTVAAVGDGADIKALEKIGARDANAGVISTGDDITASVLTTLALKDLNLPKIYAKVVSQGHARVMQKLGVTETIFPERDSAQRMARRIASPKLLNFVDLGAGFSAQEMAVPASWIGQSLRDLELPRRYRIAVIAVHDALTDEIHPIPDPDAPLKDSDSLLVAGRSENLERVSVLE